MTERHLQMGDVRQIRVGFVLGEWEKHGFSKPISIELTEGKTTIESTSGSWDPPSEDEYFEQEWDKNGQPIVSDEEWEDWEDSKYEIAENQEDVNGGGTDTWNAWEDEEEEWMNNEKQK